MSRTFVCVVLALSLGAPTLAPGQSFPSKPVRIIVPFPPGGPLDPLARGIAPITQLLYFRQFLIANSKTPYNNFREMVEHARANPGKINFGSFGEGGGAHQLLAVINQQMGINVVHVPYKGSGPALQGVLGGEVDMAVAVAPTAGPLLKAGKIKVLAVSGDSSMPEFPGIGTYRAQGFALDIRNWWGVIGGAKAPKDQITRLNRDIVKVIADADYRKKFMEAFYYEPIGNTPEQFAENLKAGRPVAEALANALKASGYRGE